MPELSVYQKTPGSLLSMTNAWVRPEDMAGAPTSYANTTDWAAAITAAYADGRPVWFGNVTYYVGSSVGPGKQGATSYFNNTTIRPKSGAAATDFNGCVSWSGNEPSTLTKPEGSNLPDPENVHVLFDVQGSRFSLYSGDLTLNCNNINALACISSSNAKMATVFAGGGQSNWSNCRLSLSNAEYGMFSQARYSDTESTYYPDCFVGCIFGFIKIWAVAGYAIVAADNNFDDCVIIKFDNVSSAPVVMQTVHINFGTIFLKGPAGSEFFAFDVQEATLSFGTLYAEGDMLAPIHLNTRGTVKGELKFGAGAVNTNIALGCMIWADANGGYADVTAHERCMDSEMEALVKLRRPASDVTVPRAIKVGQAYPLSAKPAFLYSPEEGDPTGIADSLVSHSPDGVVHYVLEAEALAGYRADIGGPGWVSI